MSITQMVSWRKTPKFSFGGFSFRPIELGDSELLRSWRISPLTAQSFPAMKITRTGHAAWLERHLKGEDGWMWVIEQDDETATPIGSIAIVNLHDPVWEIGRVIVAPEYRRAGWGRKAIMACVEIASWYGKPSLVEVMKTNANMRALCASLGFEIIGERDALVRMERRL